MASGEPAVCPAARCRANGFNLRMDRQALAAFQLDVVKLEHELGIGTLPAGLHREHMTYELRTFGNVGSVVSFYGCPGLDDDVVTGLGGF